MTEDVSNSTLERKQQEAFFFHGAGCCGNIKAALTANGKSSLPDRLSEAQSLRTGHDGHSRQSGPVYAQNLTELPTKMLYHFTIYGNSTWM